MSSRKNVPAPQSEQNFDLTSWFVLLFSLGIILLSLSQVLYRLGLPSDGWSAQPNIFGPEQRYVFERNVSSFTSPLHGGDVLLAVEGRPVEQILQQALTLDPHPPSNWKVGGSIDYTVWRDGGTRTVSVLVELRPAWIVPSSIYGTLLTDPSVIPSLLIGLFLFALRPRNRAARLLLVLTTCFFASDGIGHPAGGLQIGVSDLFYTAAYWPALFFDKLIWNFIIAPIYIHLFLVFPVPAWPIRRYPRLTLSAIYLLAPGMMLLAYILNAGQPLAFWGAWSTFSEIDYFLVLGAVILVMAHTLLRERDPMHRAQIRWVATGTLITSLGAVSGGVLAILGIQDQYPLLSLILYRLPFLAFPAGVAVAVLRHRMFDINVIINRTLVYVPLTAILAGIYAASITISQKLFISLTGQQSDAAAVLTTLLVVAAFTPIKDRLQALVDTRFKEAPDPCKRLRNFDIEVKTRVESVETRQAMRRLLQEATSAFDATSGEAYVGNGSDLELVSSIGELKGEPELKTPVEFDGRAIGVIYLGRRGKGIGYRTEESETLKQVAATVAKAIQEDMTLYRSGAPVL